MKIKDAKELTAAAICRLLTADASTSVTSALRTMKTAHVHHLVVVKDGACLGIVSMKDLLRDQSAAWWYGSTRTTTVGEVMQAFIPTVDEDTDLRTALNVMLDKGLTAIPLSRQGKLSGIVTSTDVLRALSLLDKKVEVA